MGSVFAAGGRGVSTGPAARWERRAAKNGGNWFFIDELPLPPTCGWSDESHVQSEFVPVAAVDVVAPAVPRRGPWSHPEDGAFRIELTGRQKRRDIGPEVGVARRVAVG